MNDKLLSLDFPIYMSKEDLKDLFNKKNSIKINANIKDDELYSIDFNILNGKKYLIIDMDASKDYQQKRFISLLKDKSFRTFNIDSSLKIIVSSSNKEMITDEVRGLIIE